MFDNSNFNEKWGDLRSALFDSTTSSSQKLIKINNFFMECSDEFIENQHHKLSTYISSHRENLFSKTDKIPNEVMSQWLDGKGLFFASILTDDSCIWHDRKKHDGLLSRGLDIILNYHDPDWMGWTVGHFPNSKGHIIAQWLISYSSADNSTPSVVVSRSEAKIFWPQFPEFWEHPKGNFGRSGISHVTLPHSSHEWRSITLSTNGNGSILWDSDYIKTSDEMVEFLYFISSLLSNHPYVEVTFDPSNFCNEEKNILSNLLRLYSKLTMANHFEVIPSNLTADLLTDPSGS